MQKNYELYLSFLAGEGMLDDLHAMIDPILPYFDGIRATLHTEKGSAESNYLESIKGKGKIVHSEWTRRLDFSRNKYLYETGFEDGDWFIQTDVLEHPQKKILDLIPTLIAANPTITSYYYYKKPFLVKWNENLFYHGNPHEYLAGVNSFGLAAPLEETFPDENDVRKNMRPFKRTDPKYWIEHNAKYWFYPNTNHLTNDLAETEENRGKVLKRTELRHEMMKDMCGRGFSLNVFGLKKYFSGKLPKYKRAFINNDKILQDFYRHFILNDNTTVEIDPNWESMREF